MSRWHEQTCWHSNDDIWYFVSLYCTVADEFILEWSIERTSDLNSWHRLNYFEIDYFENRIDNWKPIFEKAEHTFAANFNFFDSEIRHIF